MIMNRGYRGNDVRHRSNRFIYPYVTGLKILPAKRWLLTQGPRAVCPSPPRWCPHGPRPKEIPCLAINLASSCGLFHRPCLPHSSKSTECFCRAALPGAVALPLAA